MADELDAVLAFKRFGKQYQGVLEWWPAFAGDGQGNVNTSQANWYLARYPLQSSPTHEVFCDKMNLVDNLRIIVGYTAYHPNRVEVIDVADQRTEVVDPNDNPINPGQIGYNRVPLHWANHQYLGSDQGYVNWRQITPLGVFPTNPPTLSVQVYAGYIPRSGANVFVNSQVVNLVAHVPTTGIDARYVLISYDSTGTAVVTDGTINSLGFNALTAADIPATPAGNWRSCAIVLYTGQTAIVENRNEIDFYDLRFPEETIAGSITPGQIGVGSAQYQYIVTGATPFTPVWSSGFLNITAAKTLAVQNSLTFSGTDGGTTALAVTSGKTLTFTATDNYNLTIPATGTATLTGTYPAPVNNSGDVKLLQNGNYRGGVVFDTTGSLVAAPWTISTLSVNPSLHDNVYYLGYNARYNTASSTWERIISGEHIVVQALESRFHPTDPITYRGQMEWYIRLATGLTGAVTFDKSPFALTYNFDLSSTAVTFGDLNDTIHYSSVNIYADTTILNGNYFSVKGGTGNRDRLTLNVGAGGGQIIAYDDVAAAYLPFSFNYGSYGIFAAYDPSGYHQFDINSQTVMRILSTGLRILYNADNTYRGDVQMAGSSGLNFTSYKDGVGAGYQPIFFNGSIVAFNPTTYGRFDFGGSEQGRYTAAGFGFGNYARNPSARLNSFERNANTNTKTNIFDLVVNSSGTPAANFGSTMRWLLESSTTEDTLAAEFDVLWNDATHVSRVSDVVLSAAYSGGLSEIMRGRGGATPAWSIFGVTPQALPSAYTLTGSATRTMPTDPSGAYTGIDNAQAGTPYATVADLNTLRSAVSSLIGIVRQLLTDLAGYGLTQ